MPSNNMGALSRIILWMVVFSLALLFVPLYLVSTTIKEQRIPLEEELSVLQTQASVTPAPNPEEQTLTASLIKIREDAAALETFQISGHFNWSDVMNSLNVYNPEQMTITAILQTSPRLTLSGTADDETVVMAYAETLKKMPQFSNVEVQSMNRQIQPTPDPASTTPVTKPVTFTVLIEVATHE